MPGPRTYEFYAGAVRYKWGFHAIPCPCGGDAQLHLEHKTADVSCDHCGRFKSHRRRHGYGPIRQPTGQTLQSTLEEIDKIWCRAVPVKGTLGENILNLVRGKGVTVDDLAGTFRFHRINRSVCMMMADDDGFVCGLRELLMDEKGAVTFERITGKRGKVWPSLELLSRGAIAGVS